MENVLPEFMKVISKGRESVRSVKTRRLTLQKGEASKPSTLSISSFGKLNKQNHGRSSQKPTRSGATEDHGASKQLYRKASSAQTWRRKMRGHDRAPGKERESA